MDEVPVEVAGPVEVWQAELAEEAVQLDLLVGIEVDERAPDLVGADADRGVFVRVSGHAGAEGEDAAIMAVALEEVEQEVGGGCAAVAVGVVQEGLESGFDEGLGRLEVHGQAREGVVAILGVGAGELLEEVLLGFLADELQAFLRGGSQELIELVAEVAGGVEQFGLSGAASGGLFGREGVG
ncbi:hypothetical protein [Thermogemmatispora sp.]|uniref:hypothetical protein n=1 Tax=Thermogemmatispora sp. TaxID=1968838 RepID=UPI002ACBE8A4|nr:hypothetical protein [Thermogemmatispora sp.]